MLFIGNSAGAALARDKAHTGVAAPPSIHIDNFSRVDGRLTVALSPWDATSMT